MMRKKIVVLLSLLLCFSLMFQDMGIYAIVNSDVSVTIKETKVSDTQYKVDISLTGVSDLYGFSLDMLYDSSKVDITDSNGEPITAPVITPDTFLSQGITLNKITPGTGSINQINFVRVKTGNSAGDTMIGTSKVASIYVKVKVGQTFNGFGALTTTDDIKSLNAGNICIKLSDSHGSKITYSQSEYLAQINLGLAVEDFNGKNVTLSTMNGELIVYRGQVELRKIAITATPLVNGLGFETLVLTKADLKAGDTCYVKLAGFSSQVYTFSGSMAPDSTLSIDLDLAVGNLNSDNLINGQDVLLFKAVYGQKGNNLLADFNKDGMINIKDLYYISKNMK